MSALKAELVKKSALADARADARADGHHRFADAEGSDNPDGSRRAGGGNYASWTTWADKEEIQDFKRKVEEFEQERDLKETRVIELQLELKQMAEKLKQIQAIMEE